MNRIHTRSKLTLVLPGLLLGLLLASLVGCSQDGNPSSPATTADTGTISFSLAAEPDVALAEKSGRRGEIQYDDIVLMLCGIEAHRAAGDELDGWYSWDFEATPYSLEDLASGLSDLINGAELPVGPYNQVRLMLSPGSYVVIGGEEYPLTVIAHRSTLISLHHEFEIVEGADYAMTLLFDMRRSLSLSRSGNYQLKPRIVVIEVIGDDEDVEDAEDIEEGGDEEDVVVVPAAGSITGFVNPPAAEATVTVFAGEFEVSVPADAATGEFVLPDLAAGIYTVNLVPADGMPYPPLTMAGVEVVAGEVTDLGTVQLLMPMK